MKKISLEKALEMLQTHKRISFKTVNQYYYTKGCITIDQEKQTYSYKETITKYVIADRTFRTLEMIVRHKRYDFLCCEGE